MEQVVGIENTKISKLEHLKFIINLIKYEYKSFKTDCYINDDEKPTLPTTPILSKKRIIYLEHEGISNFNTHFHCSLNRFYHQEQYFYFLNDNSYDLGYDILKHAYFYNFEYGVKTCFYSKNSQDHHPINFFNDLFDTLNLDEIYEILNQPEIKNIEHYIQDASFLLKLLCIELKNKREKGINIDTKLISTLLDHFPLYSKNEEYNERLLAMPLNHSFQYKHNVLKGIIENQYLDLLYEAEKNGLITNDSPIKIKEIIEYKYNYILNNIPKEINSYMLKILNKTTHNIKIINFKDYCYQDKAIIENNNEATFFNILEDVEKGKIDLILSKTVLTNKVYSYINQKFKINSQKLLENNKHLLLHDNELTVIDQLLPKEYGLDSHDYEKQRYISQNIKNDFHILNEQKYLSNLLDVKENESTQKINKKRKI